MNISDYDAFSKRHPLVNFVFFIGAIGCGVVIQHPAYLIAGAICAGIYYLLLNGAKGWKIIFGMLPMAMILTTINPLFNIYGGTILFHVFGRPYTLEALMYGAAIAGVFVVMMLWFGYKIFMDVTEERGLHIPGIVRVTGLTDKQVRTIMTRQMKVAPLDLALQLLETLNVPLAVWLDEEEYTPPEVSAGAYEVARAYDKADFRDKNMARMSLKLELLKEETV